MSARARIRNNGTAAVARVLSLVRPPAHIGTREWADKYLQLPPDIGTAKPGQYRSDLTPWLWAIQDAMDDPTIQEIVCMKSAQIGWTVGVISTYIAKRIDVDPCPIVVMFPTTESAREYSDEKFSPIIDATPALNRRIDRRSRKSGNRATFKRFVGGFLKMVGSNSPRAVKSSSAPVIVVEEPDDASTDVKGQGDSITLLLARAKTHPRYKFVIGGTPTIADLSAVDTHYKQSDQRKLFVPCHHCGEEHVLLWENVRWDDGADIAHEIYGSAQVHTAAYYCPSCDKPWSDYDKNRNVRRACVESRWRATAPYNGKAGFGYLGELYVHWTNSTFANLARRWLEAKHASDNGDDAKLIAFWNSVLGLPYEYGGKRLDLEELQARTLPYAEGTVPRGGLALTVGIDTQHDRFAIGIRAWGRGEESWLVKFGEIYASSGVNDRSDKVWIELEQIVFGPYRHESGREMHALAVSIDSSDGVTSDAVYDWVRAMKRKFPHVQVMAVKGASDGADKEIFSLPKHVDHRTPTKSAKYGLRSYSVGTNKAKDLLLGSERQHGRINLLGEGPGRFHVYQGVRADYFEQLTAEVKAPSRRMRGRMVWQLRSGRRNEGLDVEVYALHAARAKKLHTLLPAHWDAIEKRMMQADLFTEPTPAPVMNATIEAREGGADHGGQAAAVDPAGEQRKSPAASAIAAAKTAPPPRAKPPRRNWITGWRA